MNQQKVKKIRGYIYGDLSPKVRVYTTAKNGQRFADDLRYNYQKAKGRRD